MTIPERDRRSARRLATIWNYRCPAGGACSKPEDSDHTTPFSSKVTVADRQYEAERSDAGE